MEKQYNKIISFIRKIWEAVMKVDFKGIFNNAFNALKKIKNILNINEDIKKIFGHLNAKMILGIIAGLVAIFYLCSGIYIVNTGEVGVVRMFGKVIRDDVKEGMHFMIPWPFQTVDKVNTAEIYPEEVGFLLSEHQGVHSSPEKLQILTGDENIIDAELIVQYRIINPVYYLFNIDYKSYQIINEVIRVAATRVLGKLPIDDILTISKEAINRAIMEESQTILENYKAGLKIVLVNVRKMYPPDEVAEAFRDVASAREDKEKAVSEAYGYKNSVIPPSIGEARRIVTEADSYYTQAVAVATGESERFISMLTEFRKSGGSLNKNDVTTNRLYLETMSKVLSKAKKYIVKSDRNGKINLKLFE